MAGLSSPTLGACGLDCGLCPRYHTAGGSRCPGCGGPDFSLKHPSCGFFNCCHRQKGLQACAECEIYPCRRFDRETGEHDSFVTHRRVLANQAYISQEGPGAFLARQEERIAFLRTALSQHDDGKSKGFFCLAAALLSMEGLRDALRRAAEGESLRAALESIAGEEGEELKLRK